MTDDRRWYIRLRFMGQGERQHQHVGPYTREVANRRTPRTVPPIPRTIRTMCAMRRQQFAGFFCCVGY